MFEKLISLEKLPLFAVVGCKILQQVVSAQFDIPSTIALGTGSLQVVMNGIPSAAVAVNII